MPNRSEKTGILKTPNWATKRTKRHSWTLDGATWRCLSCGEEYISATSEDRPALGGCRPKRKKKEPTP